MIVQFILKLIFYYCIFALVKSLVKRYIKPVPANNQARHNPYNNRSSSNNDSNVFEAEYKVVKEESES